MSNISEKIISAIFDQFRQTFRSEVLKIAGISRSQIKNQIATLVKQLPAAEAHDIIEGVIRDLDVNRVIQSEIAPKAIQAMEQISSKLAGYKKSSEAGSALDKLATVAGVDATLLEIDSYRRTITNIIGTTANLLEVMNTLFSKHTGQLSQQEVSEAKIQELESIVQKKLDHVLDTILDQVQNKV